MATLLLIVIYIGYIGLGTPDSILGTAWPEIYTEFGIPISWASFITVLSTMGTFFSSLFSPRLLNKYGVYKVTVISTAMTAAALFLFSVSNNFWVLCLLSIPLGLGGGAIDTGLNNYTAVHYKAMHINFLHCFYGIGVALSPYFISYALKSSEGWRGGYRIVSIIQIAITLVVLLSLPLWKRVKFKNNGEEVPEIEQKTLTIREMMKIPKLLPMCLIFVGSCSIEFVCGGWSSTYLVEHMGITTDTAALCVMVYYVGLALGRMTAGLISSKISGWRIIFLGQSLVLVALTIIAVAPNPTTVTIGMFLCSFGNGPLWPNLMYVTPKMFGVEVSQSVMGAEGAVATIGLMLAPALFGQIAEHVGVHLFPFYLLGLYVLMIAATVTVHAKKKA